MKVIKTRESKPSCMIYGTWDVKRENKLDIEMRLNFRRCGMPLVFGLICFLESTVDFVDEFKVKPVLETKSSFNGFGLLVQLTFETCL